MTEALKLLSLNVRGISNFKKEEQFLLGAGNAQTFFFCKKPNLQQQQKISGKTNGVQSSLLVMAVQIPVVLQF